MLNDTDHIPAAYRHESDTSREAAETLTTAKKRRRELLDLLEARGIEGVTIDEFARHLSVAPNDISGRFSELQNKGLISKTPMRRKTRAGKSACVYVLGQWVDHAGKHEQVISANHSKLHEYKAKLARAGHGHVVPRADGKKEGCGGVHSCRICKIEKDYFDHMANLKN